ncbi:helix-turn-helix domain-containing protein [Herbivorax sp. ANBcel31]|uniref:PucR family transcriptional regulator n=1 Tax=Herbivorax sp. ANBcel31 TaxID=3069754 RepID=UPI0027B01766|nr:helix-turn-helix domain-containing protein [Herbivorax sp. ANBcel31]MDQ2085405.1 helix-turn-helix domain-containing protein [Herbivorax sp. ANBcel31]
MRIKLYQNLVNQVKSIINEELGLMDDSGIIAVCSNEKKVGMKNPLISEIMKSEKTFNVFENQSFQKIYIKNKLEFIAYINSTNENNAKFLSLLSMNVVNLKSYYEDKYDKANFIKNIIMDNILLGDITLKAKELRLPNNVYRVALLIKTLKIKDIYPYEVVEGLFPNRNKDFVIILDDETTVLIKELKEENDFKELENISKVIVDTLSTEAMIKAKIGIGTIVDSIRDLGKSFKEARMALQIGEIFESEKSVINYNKLGIGRLIYQLPTTLCELFLAEVFQKGGFETLDKETMDTIQKFFENNLNISETSRQLYIHRNTLVYRLDKIQKSTGLDIKMFDDAIIFKVAVMVKKYLDSNQAFNY